MSEAFASSCSNDHCDDRWTCPGCYTELGDVGQGEHECPGCGRRVICTLETFTSCVAELSDETAS